MTHPGAGCPWRPQEHWAGAKGGIWAALWNLRDFRSPWKARGCLQRGMGRTRAICWVLVEGNQMFPAGRSGRKPELRAALPLEEAAP